MTAMSHLGFTSVALCNTRLSVNFRFCNGPYVNPSFHSRDIRSPGSCFCTGSARRPPP